MVITHIVPWPDRKLVIAHLASFDWDFSIGKAVKLVQGGAEIEARLIGSGNHEGLATVTLALDGNWSAMIPVLQKMEASGQPISIELKVARPCTIGAIERDCWLMLAYAAL